MKFPEKYTENSIRTFTDKVFDLKLLDPASICIEDIAHGLSMQPRFGGQLNGFLSVAQHSCLVAVSVPVEHRLAALLHDASEAYLGDMPSPFKKILPDFKEHENRVMEVIAEKFGFDFPLHKKVKEADYKMLSVEWIECVEKKNAAFYWTPKQAKERFLEHFYELSSSVVKLKAS
jgi:hypothetical protein